MKQVSSSLPTTLGVTSEVTTSSGSSTSTARRDRRRVIAVDRLKTQAPAARAKCSSVASPAVGQQRASRSVGPYIAIHSVVNTWLRSGSSGTCTLAPNGHLGDYLGWIVSVLDIKAGASKAGRCIVCASFLKYEM
jgi:hypothetical protein